MTLGVSGDTAGAIDVLNEGDCSDRSDVVSCMFGLMRAAIMDAGKITGIPPEKLWQQYAEQLTAKIEADYSED